MKEKENELRNEVENYIKSILDDMKPDEGATRGRPRVLPALALWAGILVCVARGFSSQLAVWRQLAVTGLWDFPRYAVSDDAVYDRLKRAGNEFMQAFFVKLTVLLRMRLQISGCELAKFASGVYALDEMTLDALAKRLPSLRERTETVLGGKISALFDLRAQMWERIEYISDPHQNSKVNARSMIEELAKGSLILADMGYFSFAWFDELTAQGQYWISRLRAKTSLEIAHILFENDVLLDAIVWLGKYRADRAEHAVRLVRITHRGRTWTYITNVLDPHQLPAQDISALYARRWDIEMMFNMVKSHLNLHLLWSAHTLVILHQVFAVFSVAQIILALRSEIAQRAHADVFDVSLELMIIWIPRIARDGHDPIQTLVERGRLGHIIRPSKRTTQLALDAPLSRYSFPPDHLVLTRTPRYAGKS